MDISLSLYVFGLDSFDDSVAGMMIGSGAGDAGLFIFLTSAFTGLKMVRTDGVTVAGAESDE